MPLEAPQLDDRKFEDLLRDARLRIPRYTPEWTDFNDSDPGITLAQLFAWFTELILYRMNQVPDLNYIKFLKLLNLELNSAKPATAHITFFAKEGAEVQPVPQGTKIAAQSPDGGDLLVFETEAGLDLIKMPLASIQVYDGTAFTIVTPANEQPGTAFRPLGWVPQEGSALYLGFSPLQTLGAGRVFPRELRFRVYLPLALGAGMAVTCQEAEQPPTPPVTLVWEYHPAAQPQRWRRLSLYEDQSAAFTREGYILVEGPGEIARTVEGKEPGWHYWLRCRLDRGSYPVGRIPEIDLIRPNTVPAVNLITIQEESLGASEGTPDQTFSLRHRPVQPESLKLSVVTTPGESECWTRKDDFLASEPSSPHYVLNATSAAIQFGDGKHGRIPVAGAEIVAQKYRYGGGKRGNIPTGLISLPQTPLVGVDRVTNEQPAVGGLDEQKLEDLKIQAPAILRSRNRTVTLEDFTALAKQAGGVARAQALSLMHPLFPGVEVPGAVTVVIVPETEEIPPEPSLDLKESVCRYLNQHRLITTEVAVSSPKFLAVKIVTRVAAKPYRAFDMVAQKVEKSLNEFLNPMKWGFGHDFYPNSLYSVILALRDDIVSVPNLEVWINGQPREISEQVKVPPDGLVYGKDHEVNVIASTDL